MSARLLHPLLGFAVMTGCDGSGPGAAPRSEPPAQLVAGDRAVEHAYVPSIDPSTMTDAEIGRVMPGVRRCAFRYTKDSDPVLVTDGTRGVVKINGDLVALTSARSGDAVEGGQLVADDLRLTVQPLSSGDNGEADLRFEVASGPGLSVGYRGFYTCTS